MKWRRGIIKNPLFKNFSTIECDPKISCAEEDTAELTIEGLFDFALCYGSWI